MTRPETTFGGLRRGIVSGPAAAAAINAAAEVNGGGERRGMNRFMTELAENFEAFKTNYDEKVERLEDAFDRSAATISALQVSGVGSAPGRGHVEDPAYSRAFAELLRSGQNEEQIRAANRTGRRAEIMASMSVGTPGSGGYLAPTEWNREINAAQITLSPMRQLAKVVTTGVGAFSTVWNARGLGSGWVGETASRPETAGLTLAPINFAAGEIYANVAATQQLLDDAQINFDSFLVNEIAAEFAKQESVAFISGNGTNKPNGILTYVTGAANAAAHPGGAILATTVAGTSAITADELIGFVYALASPYRANASWLMNSATAAALMKLKASGTGDYIFREGLAAGQPATILGRPLYLAEDMPNMTTGAIPILFGDIRSAYLINDRTGLRVLRDPFTNRPYVMFYATTRVGGGLLDPNAVRAIKMA
jgi:HK97 family phage major capsid protein